MQGIQFSGIKGCGVSALALAVGMALAGGPVTAVYAAEGAEANGADARRSAAGRASVEREAGESSGGVSVALGDGVELRWSESLRLRDILEQAAEHHNLNDVYWPSARLIALDYDLDLEAQRGRVLAALGELANEWQDDAEKQTAVRHVREQILSWRLAPQPVRHISLETSRQHINENPLLPAGRYQLYLPTRSQAFYMFGLVEQPGRYALTPGQTVRGYLQGVQRQGLLTTGFSREQVEVVSANDASRSVNWGLHNADGDELIPDDIVWVGFSDFALPREYEWLNQGVVALLEHFVPAGVGAVAGPDVAAGGVVRESGGMFAGAAARSGSVQAGTSAAQNVSVIEGDPLPANHWSRMDKRPTRGHYGNVGLMQTPTARMSEAGDISLTYSDMDVYYRYSINLQVLSWLEATGWYTRIPNRRYSDVPSFSTEILTDKGFDIKARVWQETYWTPEVSIGLRDLAGTGLFDGEFVVANKRVGAFDFSLGIGFGRTGASDNISNPFCELNDTFCERDSGMSGRGGQTEYDKWFRGPAALFGGVEWQTPHEPLRVKVEYDGNDYSRDRAGVVIDPDTQWNVGLSYDVTDWFNVQASYERGDTFMFNVTLRNNFNTMRQVRVERDKVQPLEAKHESLDDVDWQAMHRQLRRQGSFSGARFSTPSDEKVQAYVSPHRYRDMDEAVDRAARVLTAEVPETVTEIEFVHRSLYQPSFSTTVDAQAFRRRVNNEDFGRDPNDTADLFERTETEYFPVSDDDESWRFNPETRYRTAYGLRPFLNTDFGAPESFTLYQLGVGAFAHRALLPGLEVFGEVGINLLNNYDFNYTSSPDQLPTVRTDVRKYVENDTWLNNLQLNYYHRIADGLYGFVYGGYLERMFAGVGGELLWRPLDSRWAFGLDINRVRQRDFEGWLGTQDYEVTTGFASVYYQMPWLEDSMVQLDVGRFLAKDRGVRVTFQKRFESGMVAGAYASFTNVSADEYGEGSFTKGFFLAIPFDLMAVNPSREFVSFGWVPLARNGGQPLQRRFRLYDMTDDRSPFYMRDDTTGERRR